VSSQGVDAIAELALVAHADGVPLAALDRRRQGASSDGHLHHVLNVLDADAVAGDGFPVDGDLQIGLADDPVRHYGRGLDLGHLLEKSLDLETDAVEGLQVGPLDPDAQRCAHPALEHHRARGDRLELRRRREARHLGHAHDLGPDVAGAPDVFAPLPIGAPARVRDELSRLVADEIPAIVCEVQSAAPLVRAVLGVIVDHDLEHGHGRRVEGALGSAELANGRLHLGDGRDAPIEGLQLIQGLPDRGVGHGGGHVQEGALVQGRHELLSQVTPCGDPQQEHRQWRCREASLVRQTPRQ
jgi:hypothetical protein